MPINVYLIEDHPVLRKALVAFLNRLSDLYVCGSAETAQAALTHLPHCTADVALVNVSLPDMNGTELVRKLRIRHPHLPCIMLSSAEHRFYVEPALAAGARGYIVKGSPAEIEEAIHCVLTGKVYLNPVAGSVATARTV